MSAQRPSTTASSRPRIAAIEPLLTRAASAIASPRSRTSAIDSAGVIRQRGRERRELADRMADDVVRLETASAQRSEHGQARRDESGLLDLGLHELLDRSFEAEPLAGRGPKPRCPRGRPPSPPEPLRRSPCPFRPRGTPAPGSRTRRYSWCATFPVRRPFDQSRAPREACSHSGHAARSRRARAARPPPHRRARAGSSPTKCCHSGLRSRLSSPPGCRASGARSSMIRTFA